MLQCLRRLMNTPQTLTQPAQALPPHPHLPGTNRLSIQLTQASMCVGAWSLLRYVRDSELEAVTVLPDLKEGEEEESLEDIITT
jgi:hypothetical protein